MNHPEYTVTVTKSKDGVESITSFILTDDKVGINIASFLYELKKTGDFFVMSVERIK